MAGSTAGRGRTDGSTIERYASGLSPRGYRALGVFAVAALALPLANCGPTTKTAGRHASEIKYGVPSSPRVIPEGEPIPKGGGRDMVGKPYVVAGRTYIPHAGKGYDREGWASWYGSAFHGRLTANGEIFDRDSVAAAHPTLPLPSYVRVTNLVNKRSMVVRVNDRGPYERDRVIDLSERAADALGFHRKGTSRVRVQYVGRASLAGSDDEKLLASLRTDGEPATMEPPRVVLAKTQEMPQPQPAAKPKMATLAQAPVSREAKAEEARPGLRRPAMQMPSTGGPAVRAAQLDGERRGLGMTPPRRPDFKGVN